MRRIDNISGVVTRDELSGIVNSADDLDIAVGYVTKSGIDLLETGFKDALLRGGRLRVRLGMLIRSGITQHDIDKVTELNGWNGKLQGTRVRVTKRPYHGKLYLGHEHDKITAFLGRLTFRGVVWYPILN